MDMSLAEDAQETMAAQKQLSRFYTTSKIAVARCLRLPEIRRIALSSRNCASNLPRPNRGASPTLSGGAIPFDTVSRRRYYPDGVAVPASKSSARRVILLTISR